MKSDYYLPTLYVVMRNEWRKWLETHFEKEEEIWLVYPKKSSGKARILYNDAVEEALCFGWIDSTIKSLDEAHSIQRFSPRRSKSSFSQPNRERLKWLDEQGMIHLSVRERIGEVLRETFIFPLDIVEIIKKDATAWKYYQNFSESYKRIRVAYIEAARKRPNEFEKRLLNFMKKTRENKLIKGYGGIEKYY